MEKADEEKIRSFILELGRSILCSSDETVWEVIERNSQADHMIAAFGWSNVFSVMSGMMSDISDKTVAFLNHRNRHVNAVALLLMDS